MSRFRQVFASLVMSLALVAPAFAQQPAPPVPAPPTAAEAAPFMGDWTIAAESQMGPTAMALTIKIEADKVQGEISSEQMPKTVITDVVKSGPSLLLRYSFDFQGMAIPVVVTLTPGATVAVSIDFAGGAFVMAGTATKVAK